MMVHKCDKCGEEIERNNVRVTVGSYHMVELCRKCDQPVLDFLDKSGLLQDELIKNGFINKPGVRGPKKVPS